jgi:predicted Zn-dependent protease
LNKSARAVDSGVAQTSDRPATPARGPAVSDTTERTASLDAALALTERLLAADPARAALQAREILAVVPGHPKAQFLLACALAAQGDPEGACRILEPLAATQPKVAAIHVQLGIIQGALGRSAQSIAALRRATAIAPDHPSAWRELADQLSLAGDAAGADAAYARHIKASVHDPQLLQAAAALCDNRLAVAEKLLRDYLKDHPTDVAAIRMLGETGSRLGRYEDAANLLARCLELAPGFAEARANYAGVLYRANKPAEAVAQSEILLRRDPRNPAYRNMMGAALARMGESERALAAYAGVLKDYPQQPKAWMSYGHTLKVVGRQDESIAAYRRSIEQLPRLGEAWWSLANLKTFRFTADDIATMRAQILRDDLDAEDRFHLHFALGKALEDEADYAGSFAHYAEGNALRKKRLGFNPDESTDHVRRSRAVFTPEFFRARQGQGNPARDPIFIVGLPRSGSTLIEQILSSHSAVEGTMELPDIMSIAGRLGARKRKGESTLYPEKLCELGGDELVRLGEEYLERTRPQRRTGRPFFTDKMPNNFAHAGLIHLILPNARIIDARRHPLGCCFSNFKQHFARGQGFTYDLAGMGRYYREYVELMAHYDAVLPGRIHRVIYERMVEDSENEVRRLLDYCGLPFEDSCLRFYENDRAVRTASSEQVRRPIYRDAVEHWQHYEVWLDPLKTALGPVLELYPDVPVF